MTSVAQCLYIAVHMVTAQQTAIRFTPDDLAILDALQEALGLNRSDVVRLAIRRLAKLEGVELTATKKRTK